MAVPERGAISMRLYPHNELDGRGVVDELRAQARLAAESGFDGVMNSEHHGGFAGYSPNPVQLAGWLLEAMPDPVWCAPCPLLLPLRPTALVAEEVAWLAARFPGRVAVGVAPGALPLDFEVMDVPFDEHVARFEAALPALVAMLSGRDLGRLEGDRALRDRAADPVTVISTAMSPAAVRRAAAAGAGIVYDGASTAERLRSLTARYDAAGGPGPRVLIRRVWLGDPPREAFDRQQDVYRSYTPAAAQAEWRDSGFMCRDDAAALAAELAAVRDASGADVLNLRIHVPGVDPAAARDQIVRLGREVLPHLRVGVAP